MKLHLLFSVGGNVRPLIIAEFVEEYESIRGDVQVPKGHLYAAA